MSRQRKRNDLRGVSRLYATIGAQVLSRGDRKRKLTEMYQASYINGMENLKTTTQIANESGLSKERVNQFARTFHVQKLGSYYVWNEEQEKLLYSRIGQRGKKIK